MYNYTKNVNSLSVGLAIKKKQILSEYMTSYQYREACTSPASYSEGFALISYK